MRIIPLIIGLIVLSSASAQTTVEEILGPYVLQDVNGKELAAIRIYGVSRTSPPHDQPIIFVEGLDLALEKEDTANRYGDRGRPEFQQVFESPITKGAQNMWNVLLDAGYDFYLVDIKSFDTTIQDLATVLNRAMSDIRATRLKPTADHFKVVGASIGGVISRLSLRQAELLGADHHSDLLLTLDSPHRGAIIPVQLQTFADFWQNYSASAVEFRKRFDWQSVKETLIRRQYMLHRASDQIKIKHLDPTVSESAFVPFQLLHQSSIPQQVNRMIAFSNGSRIGSMQYNSPFEKQLFLWDFDPFGPGDFKVEMWALGKNGGGGDSRQEYGVLASPTTADITEKLLVVSKSSTSGEFNYFRDTPAWFDEIDIGSRTFSGQLFNIESSPGGYRTTYKEVAESLKAGFDAIFDNVPSPSLTDMGQHSFIPVSSALDLNVNISMIGGVFALPSQQISSSFHRVYMAADNTEHVDISAYSVALEAELLDNIVITPSFPKLVNNIKTPTFQLKTSKNISLYYSVELTTDNKLFYESQFGHLRNNQNFYSSWITNYCDQQQTGQACRVEAAPNFQFIVPPGFFSLVKDKGVLFYRFIVSADPEGNNRYLTTQDLEFHQAKFIKTGDSDVDSLWDYEETVIYGTDPEDSDTDDDGIPDAEEVNYWGNEWNADYDSDGKINLLDSDSDNDNTKDGDDAYPLDPRRWTHDISPILELLLLSPLPEDGFPHVTNYRNCWVTRTDRFTYHYGMTVTVKNVGDTEIHNLKMMLTGVPDNRMIASGTSDIGSLAPGEQAATACNPTSKTADIKTILNRRVQLGGDWSWKAEFDSNGTHYVIPNLQPKAP